MIAFLLTLLALGAEPLDLNKAAADELSALPGLGPAKAATIVAWRESNGAFSTVDALLEVPTVGRGTVENLRPHVFVTESSPHRDPQRPDVVDVNQAGAKELATLPGIGARVAESIVAERKRRGRFDSCEDLTQLDGIGPATIAGFGGRCVAR